MPTFFHSRKLWAAIVGLVFIFVNAWLNQTQVDPDTVTNAIMGIIAAYMASTAWEDGKKAEAQGTKPAGPVQVAQADNVNIEESKP
jgi:hypothetical protein